MNCQRVQDNFIDYQDGSLPADESAQLRAHLTSCPTCQREWAALQEMTRKLDSLPEAEPSPRLRENFYAMLETHQREVDAPSPFALARSRIDRFFAALLPEQPALQFAFALALLVCGLLAGQRYLAKPGADPERIKALEAQIAETRSQMDQVGRLVVDSLVEQKSTSARIQNVLATMDQQHPNQKVLSDTLVLMQIDPSINVRLLAVESLAQHSGESLVRSGVLSALPRERAPLVQVAMIELLVNAREPAAESVFEKLSRDEAVDLNVRNAARRALAALRLPVDPAPAANTKSAAKPILT
jgi:anti-sigma factor ChrR (cupin superfamily)